MPRLTKRLDLVGKREKPGPQTVRWPKGGGSGGPRVRVSGEAFEDSEARETRLSSGRQGTGSRIQGRGSRDFRQELLAVDDGPGLLASWTWPETDDWSAAWWIKDWTGRLH
jgi:hypothetical protein